MYILHVLSIVTATSGKHRIYNSPVLRPATANAIGKPSIAPYTLHTARANPSTLPTLLMHPLIDTAFFQMLITGQSSPATARSFGDAGGGGFSRCSPALIWPGASRNQQDSHTNPSRRRQRSRSITTGTSSSSSLHAMAIPARCALPSVDLLRQAYGPRRNFWGDLSPAETRRFYHELLPVSVYLEAVGAKDLDDGTERPLGGGMSGGGLATVVDVANQQQGAYWECFFGAAETLEERARLASMARHAARLYVRERCRLPSRVVAHLYDGLRHLKQYGSFR